MVVIRYTQVYVDISEFLKGTYLRLFSNLRFFKRGSVCTIKITMRYDLYNPFLYFGNSTYIGNPN